jgi:hypothetical protein
MVHPHPTKLTIPATAIIDPSLQLRGYDMPPLQPYATSLVPEHRVLHGSGGEEDAEEEEEEEETDDVFSESDQELLEEHGGEDRVKNEGNRSSVGSELLYEQLMLMRELKKLQREEASRKTL